MTAFDLNLYILAATCLLTWLLSLITKDHSWVDRIWSIVPAVYAWVFAAGANLQDSRLNIMATLISLWGARLTFNFARKGGYRAGGEDYRWEILRNRMTRVQFEAFNIVFIVGIQNLILFAITLPMNSLLQTRPQFSIMDVVLVVVFVGLLVLETVADQQQWNFHLWKRQELASGRSVGDGFLQKGLFGVSRHPNFFAEQAQWWVIALFATLNLGTVDWSMTGAAVLTLLFLGSTRFTEEISSSKYPAYSDYQRRVSMLVPWPSRKAK